MFYSQCFYKRNNQKTIGVKMLIKSGCHDKHILNGIEYYYNYNKFIRKFIYKPIKKIQKALWLCGIAVHDPIFGECTPDFNCCCKVGRKAFFKLAQKNEA